VKEKVPGLNPVGGISMMAMEIVQSSGLWNGGKILLKQKYYFNFKY
jgi:hypothetical protein